ncbi:MAG TPA: hypothetical protein VIL84_12060 [Devosiaceae bacterium]
MNPDWRCGRVQEERDNWTASDAGAGVIARNRKAQALSCRAWNNVPQGGAKRRACVFPRNGRKTCRVISSELEAAQS